jgi:hypothetical protein
MSGQSLADALAARKAKLHPTTTVVTHMYQIFSTIAIRIRRCPQV